jgi:hypothetical protein
MVQVQEAQAEVGVVTLGGDPAGVNLGGERRWLPVYSPGGYAWRPTAGDKVLVLKAGGERELPCIVGKAQKTGELQAGQVRLAGDGTGAVVVGGDTVALTGTVELNGETLEEYIQRLVAQMLA